MDKEYDKWYAFRPWRRHSLVLLIGGLVYIGIGSGFMMIEELSQRQEASLVVALRIVPMKWWGLQFIAAGSLSVLSSKWPAFSDMWGYAILTSLASAWSAIYFLGYFMGDAPNTNLISGLLWALVAFMWWAISGLVNPDRRLVMRDDSN